MIQHIILFTLRDNTAEDKRAFIARLDHLLDEVPSIRRFTLADHFAHEQTSDANPQIVHQRAPVRLATVP